MLYRTGYTFAVVLAFTTIFGMKLEQYQVIGSTAMPTASVERLIPRISAAHAETIGSRRAWQKAKREAAERERIEAAKRQRLEQEKTLQGTTVDELPVNCVYDSYASAASSSELYLCDGKYYQKYGEGDRASFVVHPVEMNREEVKEALARKRAEDIRRRAEEEKRLKQIRTTTLPARCWYNTYVSAASGKEVYSCGDADYQRYEENGTAGYQVIP